MLNCWVLSWTVNTELIYKTQQQRIVCNQLVTEIWWFSTHGLVIVSIPCLHGRCKRDPGVPGVWSHKTPNPGVEKRDPGVESLLKTHLFSTARRHWDVFMMLTSHINIQTYLLTYDMNDAINSSANVTAGVVNCCKLSATVRICS